MTTVVGVAGVLSSLCLLTNTRPAARKGNGSLLQASAGESTV